MDSTKQIAVEETIQMIVHEIRNPLAAIQAANQALLYLHTGKSDGIISLETFTDIIARNVGKIEKLLHELLHAVDDEPGEFSPTDICAVIDTALNKAEDRIFLKDIEINKSYSDSCMVMGNADRLTLVFLNIIVNSLEAVKAHTGKLWITVFTFGNEVKAIFKDNGEGMQPEVAARIFDQHFSTKPDGLGMGLANVKKILQQHHAAIAVHSEPGKGTSFVITFKSEENDH